MLIKSGKAMRGQSLVEFALIIPIMVLIIIGVFEFSRMFLAWLTVQNSAQSAARYASTGQGYMDGVAVRLDSIRDQARSRAVGLDIDTSAGPSSPGYFRVYVYAGDEPVAGKEAPGGPNALVAVDVVFNYPLITPLVNMIAPYIRLTGHSEMINEQFRHPGFGTPPGLLPATIAPTPTPKPTNTPAITPIPTMLPTFTATVPTPLPTITTLPTYTTAPTNTTAPTSTTQPTSTTRPTPTATPCPWYCSSYPWMCPPGCRP
jgi:Flp pilus assembly protein TadG